MEDNKGKIVEKELEDALIFAGKNREELEKLLVFYSQHPKDSLKYRAACFLIKNMPRYESCNNPIFEEIKREIYPTAIKEGCSPYNAFLLLKEKYHVSELNCDVVFDSHIITAGYVIQNIEWAFRVWEEMPWGKFLSFEQFCEEILPYRVKDESLEYWRGDYYKYFRTMLDSTVNQSSLSACQIIYDKISQEEWLFDVKLSVPSLGPKTLLNYRYGGCLDRCDLMVYALRACGIPSGIDFIIQSPEKKNPHHYWNYFRNEQDKTVEFAIEDLRPDSIKKKTHFKKGKVYRKTFGFQEKTLSTICSEKEIPLSLKDDYMIDVSKDYFPEEKAKVVLWDNREDNSLPIYLSVFNNTDWIPIGWTTDIEQNTVLFSNLEPEVLYMAIFYEKGKAFPASVPFIYTGKNKIRTIEANTEQLQTISLKRKYSWSERLDIFQQRLLGGKFQVADNPEFVNAITLHEITKLHELSYQTIHVKNVESYRYARYISGKGGYCNIGEIQFLSEKNTHLLTGNIIGSDPSADMSVVFDNDPLTFYNAWEADDAWVGLDFGVPVLIDKIRYIGRNDDNGIRKGDMYELFYFSKHGWNSLGKQIGTESGVLVYENAPTDALFWLRNLTRGEEERIFTIEDREQVFW